MVSHWKHCQITISCFYQSVLHKCQQKLLKQEIINKKRRLKLVKKDLLSVKNELMFKLKWIDFHHVCNLFLTGNDKSISKHQKIQDKKFYKLFSFDRENNYQPR